MPEEAKRIWFFHYDPTDLKTGHAAFCLRQEKLQERFPQIVTVNSVAQDLPPTQLDLLIVEDEVEEMEHLIESALEADGIGAIGVCYSSTILRTLMSRGMMEPRAMTLDFHLREPGQASLAPAEALTSTRDLLTEM